MLYPELTTPQIFDGEQGDADKTLLRWCNSSAPSSKTFVTLTNKALVKFRSGDTYAAKGFLINFETNCGYTVSTNSSGMIRLHDSGTAKNCTWVITSPDPLARIQFSVNHFSGNATNFRDVMRFNPEVSVGTSNTVNTLGNRLTVHLTVDGPTVLEASYSVYEDCKSRRYT